jgi:electron transfer flavoprotein-quinone oxidoreductase
LEQFDVVIIGGGSAGLAALKKVSDLGKQGILIESGPQIGTKNISGGILYSTKAKEKIYNVEDIYGNDFTSSPAVERLITEYILHATSGNKIFSIDLTPVHEYQTNFGYSVLLNKLNSWFAERASETAEKQGGGIISGVHVRDIQLSKDMKALIYTDELEEFKAKTVIAADGVNSEIAESINARQKFSPDELYQGVKIVIKLPEEIIEERFGLKPLEGAAHLFAGDVTENHIGGCFLYTNLDTLSLGAVYHYDSLMSNPLEPSMLINKLVRNPFISEHIKDEIVIETMDKNLSKEEQLRKHLTVSKLIKNYNELRYSYYSSSKRNDLINTGKYRDATEIKNRLDYLKKEINEKYNSQIVTNYVELEYSAKLIPDGKRCRMKRPYYKNILFIGDAAGRGIFVGPRIEGLNVGIDDAARAAIAASNAIDKNNFESSYLGEYYTSLVEDSPYTRDMKMIDKGYMTTFVNSLKNVQSNILGSKYNLIFKLLSGERLRGLAIDLVNFVGYDKFLSLAESEDTYIRIPTEGANKLGKVVEPSYTPLIPSLAERIAKLRYNDDNVSHIIIKNSKSEFMKKLVILCPTQCYSIESGDVVLQHEGCIECGSCAKETEWRHPKGEKGVCFTYG